MRSEELNLISNSWFRSYRDGSADGLRVRPDLFTAGQNRVIKRLLGSHGATVMTLADVPEEVIAWTCRNNDTVHYVYVKLPFRRKGLASILVEGAKQFSHLTRVGTQFFRKNAVQFNPFSLR